MTDSLSNPSLGVWWNHQLSNTGMPLYSENGGHLDAANTRLSYVNGLQAQIDSSIGSISVLSNYSIKLWWNRKFPNTGMPLDANREGYFDASNTSIKDINGHQAQIALINNNLPYDNRELLSSVGRFYGANL